LEPTPRLTRFLQEGTRRRSPSRDVEYVCMHGRSERASTPSVALVGAYIYNNGSGRA
jgi:hypothetical protein